MNDAERGKCHYCGGDFQLKKDGTLRVHGGTERLMNCRGSGSLPTMQQYGVRWATGAVFAYDSKGSAKREMAKYGNGTLVVHEGVPGTTADEWTDWVEVES